MIFPWLPVNTPSEVDKNLLRTQAKNVNVGFKDGNVFIYKLIMMDMNLPSARRVPYLRWVTRHGGRI